MSSCIRCPSCKHYKGGLKCTAYPKRIPSRIVKGEEPHSQVQPDQEGETVFEIHPDLLELYTELGLPTT